MTTYLDLHLNCYSQKNQILASDIQPAGVGYVEQFETPETPVPHNQGRQSRGGGGET